MWGRFLIPIIMLSMLLFSSCVKIDTLFVYNPEDLGEFPFDYYKVEYESDGYKIYGIFVPAQPTEHPEFTNITVVYCHGNAGNVLYYSFAPLFFHELGVNFFMFDYRGFGKSEGEPTEEGLYRDAVNGVNYISTNFNINTNYLYYVGYSLGGGVATELTLRKKPRALILISTFTSMDDMAEFFSTYDLPSSLFINAKFDNINKIDKIRVPLLVIHGTADDTVPFWQGQKLYEKAKAPKYYLWLEGADHQVLKKYGTTVRKKIIEFFLNTMY